MMIGLINKLPKDVKKSVTDQLKLLSWAIAGMNGYFKGELGLTLGLALAIFCWVSLQFFAHYIMYIVDKGDEE